MDLVLSLVTQCQDNVMTWCAPLPSSQSYTLSSLERSVGHVVKVTCTGSDDPVSSSSKERVGAMTTALKCLPDLRWNDTVPSCHTEHDNGQTTDIVLVLVWTIGGVLVFTLIILIALIIKSKNKTGTNHTSVKCCLLRQIPSLELEIFVVESGDTVGAT
ncbi:hypothetical protein ElyMa_000983800 [Elysia marginata]|uniref:Fibronectin type-III domain-containing protein n=1 Tax=Elysia marginata TaxID=1093978 RepID=A0AAV4HIX2_9GAST|nr:hypothetical protein ElyMa_000983800 [Elysia marginata]